MIVATHRSTVRRAATAVAALLFLGTAACGSGDTDTATTETTTAVDAGEESTDELVKNRPLNNCVSVISGERPASGVSIPRCDPKAGPTTTIKKR